MLGLFKPEYFVVYKKFYYLAEYSRWIVSGSMFYLMNKIFDYRVKFNEKFYNGYILSYVLIPLLLLIPSIRNSLFIFNAKECYGITSKYIKYWNSIQMTMIFIGLLLGQLKAKQIGIKDVLIVTLYIAIPIFFWMLDYWWASTISLMFTSLFLIILVGITYQRRVNVIRAKENEIIIENKDIKSKLLLTQIQPHFLYNSLTTLKYLCETSPKEASELCDNFSDYLRANIDAIDDDGLVPFEKELTNIENYLKIEKARFGERIKYQFDVETSDFLIPVLSIQTIVENAVKKGICKRKEGGLVTIEVKEEKQRYVISVIDNGVGFDMKDIADEKIHVGIKNTSTRLNLIGGTMDVKSEINKGTTVTCYIPKENV